MADFVWATLHFDKFQTILQSKDLLSRLLPTQVTAGLDRWSLHSGQKAALAVLRLHFGQFLLPWAIGAVVERDFLTADRILQDMGQFVLEPSKGALTSLAKVFPSLQPAAEQWCQLEQEVQHYRVLKDALHRHSLGASQLEKALQGQEELSMDLAWYAHDQLKEAAAGACGFDAEVYCLVSTSLARFYLKVVKTPDNREKGTILVRKILQEAQVSVKISPRCPVAFNRPYFSSCRETCTPGTGGGLPLLSWRKYRCCSLYNCQMLSSLS
jgi:hypothetical protein